MAGMLFVNDEGTENGGLIQNGRMTADGKVRAGLALLAGKVVKTIAVTD